MSTSRPGGAMGPTSSAYGFRARKKKEAAQTWTASFETQRLVRYLPVFTYWMQSPGS
jgi:hypothetical protein